MTDIFNKIKGHITVETIDKYGKVIDVIAKDNTIMDNARLNVSQLVAGVTTGSIINKFVIGTEGNEVGDMLTPKYVSPTRTQLFSEETGGYNYPIVFSTTGTDISDATIVSEPDNIGISTINVTSSLYDVTYLITIPAGNANSTGTAVFTEAALYADELIFSMKTFAAKIKDGTVSLRITWKISF